MMSLSLLRIEGYKLIRLPLTWVLMSISLLLISLLFYRLCVDYLQLAQQNLHLQGQAPSISVEIIKPLCSWTIILFATLLPLLTANAFSQEFRQKTFYLLATSHKASSIVLAKYVSLFIMFSVQVAALLLIIATLNFETALDWGMITSAILAIIGIGSCFLSFGLFMSSLTSWPLVAIGLTFLGYLFWLLLEWLNPFPAQGFFLAKELSLLSHSYRLLNGMIYIPDLLYYVFFSIFWLVLCHFRIAHKLVNVE